MLLTIRHETIYHYTAPLTYTIQQLRLSPRVEPHQHVRQWHIRSSGVRNPFVDAYDNVSHMLTITGLHNEVKIVAEGVIEITPLFLGRLTEPGSFSPLVFTMPTRLTQPTPTIVAFAHQHLSLNQNRIIANNVDSNQLIKLAAAICAAVAYEGGVTGVTTSADAALALGRGVCQDHAHIFLACCHAVGIPARYVSGYIDAGSTDHAESHAWVDVWVQQSDFTGWVSIDVTHALFASQAYCRLAIGRDYDSAAPVRGVRQGGGDESMSVRVSVSTQMADQ